MKYKKIICSSLLLYSFVSKACATTTMCTGVINSPTTAYNYMGSELKELPAGQTVVLNLDDNKYGVSAILNGYQALLEPTAVTINQAQTSAEIYLGVCKLDKGSKLYEEPNSNTVIADIEGTSYGIVRGIVDNYFRVDLGAFTGFVKAEDAIFSDSISSDLVEDAEVAAFREKVVAECQKYLGIKYVWGGTTTNGFDCSGLVQYVYKQLGITIPRVARDQCEALTPVSITELLPGDLVFFKKGDAAVHHVGMYVGNGQMIHAPYTGTTVQYQTLREGSYRETFYRGGRVIF